MAKVLDRSFEVSKFQLQLCFYIHFQTNTLWKGMNLTYPSSYGLKPIVEELRRFIARVIKYS